MRTLSYMLQGVVSDTFPYALTVIAAGEGARYLAVKFGMLLALLASSAVFMTVLAHDSRM